MSQSVDSTVRPRDVIVVGNGVLGLSLGLVLARSGVDVAVVGKSIRPWAASAAAGAMNGCFGEVTPGMLDDPHRRAKLEMDMRATALWKEWEALLIEESDESALRCADGTVVILNTIGVPEIDTAGYATIRSALAEYNVPYQDLDPGDIDWLEPEPTSRPLQAMYIPDEHAVDSGALLRSLTTAFQRAGGVLVDDLVADLQLSDDKVRGVTLSSGATLSSPAVVLAAGSASHHLLGALPGNVQDRIPAMVSGYGVALLMGSEHGKVPKSVIRTPNRAFACGLHVVPRPDGMIYLGATNNISPQPRNSAAVEDLNLLLGCTKQLRTDLVEARVEQILVGNRPVPLDGFPLLGEVGIPGLWMMTGTYRDGLHQSPLLAHDFAARLRGEPPDTSLDIFTPVRPPIQPLTREECLESAVAHTLALGYENDWGIPVDWPPVIEEHLRRSYAELLDDLDPEFTPPPELLAFEKPEIFAALRTYYAAWRGQSGGQHG